MAAESKRIRKGMTREGARIDRVLGHLSSRHVAGELKAQEPITTRQKVLQRPEFSKLGEKAEIEMKDVKLLKLEHIKDYVNAIEFRANCCERSKLDGFNRGYNRYTDNDEAVIMDIIRKQNGSTAGVALMRAGARSSICWKRGEVVAAIVTCGGLCPGLNTVIKVLVDTLYYNYGVDYIWGVKWGFRGIWNYKEVPWKPLTPKDVLSIHEAGGTILGSSRGGFDLVKMVDALVENKVNQLYIIGGDGTHRGAHAIYHEAKKRGVKMTVAGIPKTIDNDVGIIDKSFGFSTAVEEAVKAVRSSVTEATCVPNGIGITKLMGREAGYIAAHAVIASRRVDLCLVPEVPIKLEGEEGVLDYVYKLTKKQGHCVIVVAEGAGLQIMRADSQRRDESGNIRLPSIGTFLKEKINKYFKSKGEKANIKYHDPSYMIRSIKANASDTIMCNILAENAVHGAMAGFTGFTSAFVNNRSVYIPIPAITATSPIKLNPLGRTWERVCNETQQPRARWE